MYTLKGELGRTRYGLGKTINLFLQLKLVLLKQELMLLYQVKFPLLVTLMVIQ